MDIESIAAMAAQVGSEFETSRAALEEKQAAEAELLALVVEKVKPALRALASRIRCRYRSWWPDNVSTAEESQNHEERGFRVTGDGPEKDYPRANRGSYEGRALYLLSDGTFAEVEYTGDWSNWQGATSEWESTLFRINSTRGVVEHWKLDDVLKGISEALEKQEGSREKATEAAKKRTEQLRAVAALVRK